MSNEACVPAPPEASSVPFATTLHVRDHCLCLHTQRAARSLARRFDEALRPVGLRSGQFSILMSLNRPEPPTLGAVAQLLSMDRTTLTANLKPLEREGLVQLRVDARDKRARRLLLTAKGQVALARATPIWTREHAAIEVELGEGEADRLRGTLKQLV